MKKSIFISLWISVLLFILSISTYAQKLDQSEVIQFSRLQAQQLLPGSKLISAEPYLDCREEVLAYSLDYSSDEGEAINMLLSADQSRYPVIRYSLQSNPDKQRLEVYVLEAASFMTEPQHKATYFFSISECWFLFCQNSDSIFICTNPAIKSKTSDQFREYKHRLQLEDNLAFKTAVDQEEVSDQWKRLEGGELLKLKSWNYIPSRNDIPDFFWHTGCTPLAAANVLAYYEAVYGYGNMISYYYEEADAIQGGTDATVPNILTWLANYMGTNENGSTVDASMGLHIAQAGEMQDPSYDASDYGLNVLTPWSRLKSEIDDGYPCVLSCDMPGADITWHSMTAVGYNENPDQVAVYNINDRGITNYDWNELTFPNVGWVHFPLVNRANGIRLTSLKGENGSNAASDILHTNENYEITWTSDRPGDGKVSIELNDNSGVGSWETLVSLNSNPGQWVWMPGVEHVGDENRIRVVWYRLNDSRLGYDASYSNFTVNSEDLYDLSNGACIQTNWPEALMCGYNDHHWVVMAIHQTNINVNNTLAIYPDTTFQTKIAEDHVGRDYSTKWGLCGVNIGTQNAPPGPFGVQVIGEGEGYIQFMESEELQWGTSGNYEYWGQNQIVKAYHFYVDSEDMTLLYNTNIYLENFISDDLSMYLFDLSKRYFSADDALLVADNAISGGDEHLTIPDRSSGRFLLVIRNKSLSIGNYRLSLVNEARALEIAEIPWDTPDTLFYSGAVMALPLDESAWNIAGVLPLGEAQWGLSIAQDCTFVHPDITSLWPKPYTNILIMKKNTNPEVQYYLKASRISKSGNAHIELNHLSDELPLSDGLNSPREWPAGKAFHLVPIVSNNPLFETVGQVEASDGRKIFCGIVPNIGERFLSTSMLWGSPNRLPLKGNREIKTGVVALWTQQVPTESFSYIFRARMFTVIENLVIPKVYSLTAYPNPFNQQITIEYHIPENTDVELLIYDYTGKVVKTITNSFIKAGHQKFIWNGLDDNSYNVSSGLYIIKLKTYNYIETHKIMLLK